MIPDLVADSTINVHFQMCKKCAKCFRIYRKTLKWLLKKCTFDNVQENVQKMCKQMCKKCAKCFPIQYIIF